MIFQSAHSTSQRASLFVFEDNDVVIKVGSPTRRHTSRTHRVNLDWFYDRMNVDSGIQIKYVNTSKQIADNLTRGSCSRDRWLQLTHMRNLVIPHMHSCSRSVVFSSVQKKDDEMSKRLPEPITESATAKQRPVRNVCAFSHHLIKFVINGHQA